MSYVLPVCQANTALYRTLRHFMARVLCERHSRPANRPVIWTHEKAAAYLARLPAFGHADKRRMREYFKPLGLHRTPFPARHRPARGERHFTVRMELLIINPVHGNFVAINPESGRRAERALESPRTYLYITFVDRLGQMYFRLCRAKDTTPAQLLLDTMLRFQVRFRALSLTVVGLPATLAAIAAHVDDSVQWTVV